MNKSCAQTRLHAQTHAGLTPTPHTASDTKCATARSAPRTFRIMGRLAVDGARNATSVEAQGSSGSWVQLVDGEYMLKHVSSETANLTPHMQSFQVRGLRVRMEGGG